MKRHPRDKFGRVLCGPQRISYRHHQPLVLDVGGAHFNVRYKRLRYVAEPEESHDCVTKGYVESNFVSVKSLHDLDERIKLLETKSEHSDCLKLDATKQFWDAKGFKLSNVGAGLSSTDASVLSQICRYDESGGNFKCGTRIFNLVETSADEPVLTGGTNRLKDVIIKTYGSDREYVPTSSLRWTESLGKVFDYMGREIVWDPTGKIHVIPN